MFLRPSPELFDVNHVEAITVYAHEVEREPQAFPACSRKIIPAFYAITDDDMKQYIEGDKGPSFDERSEGEINSPILDSFYASAKLVGDARDASSASPMFPEVFIVFR